MNVADEKQVKAQEEQEKNEYLQIIEDYRTLIDLPSGYRFFKRFFEFSGVLDSSMTGNSYTFFNEGYRACALKIWDELSVASPEKVGKLFVDLHKNYVDKYVSDKK